MAPAVLFRLLPYVPMAIAVALVLRPDPPQPVSTCAAPEAAKEALRKDHMEAIDRLQEKHREAYERDSVLISLDRLTYDEAIEAAEARMEDSLRAVEDYGEALEDLCRRGF